MRFIRHAVASLRRRTSHFRSDESGTATIEAMLWLPLFFALILVVMDASMAFNAQTRAMRIVQDTNRALAVGRIADVAQARMVMLSSVAKISPGAAAASTISNGIVTSSIRMPIEDLTMFGRIHRISGVQVYATSQQMVEN
jgi:Flp pilus assembly protein TadG